MRASSQRFQIKKPVSFADRLCARDWIRTSTTFRMLPPEDSASTNFATRAFGLKFEVRGFMSRFKLGVANIMNHLTSNLKPQTSNLKLQTIYTLTLKSLSASFKLVFRSVLGLRCPIMIAQPTPYSPAGNFFV